MIESELCAEFIKLIDTAGKWTCYAETAGFDILLVRKSDGVQIGIEAKLAERLGREPTDKEAADEVKRILRESRKVQSFGISE